MRRILCLGDSLTYGYGVRRAHAWPQRLAEQMQCPVENAGVSGDTTAGMLARFAARDKTVRYTHLIVMGGSNDLIMGLPVEQPLAHLRTIIYQAVQSGMEPTVGIPVKPGRDVREFALFTQDKYDMLEQGRAALKEGLLEFSASGICKVIDFHDFIEGQADVYLDGLHLNEKGNRLVSEGLYGYAKRTTTQTAGEQTKAE
ncbi:MAG: GDSL-type esterase/lipase family protein [Bacillota bacterium]|nr:GDSL-type esterase/lipase family protein [Bacillota bacterium]